MSDTRDSSPLVTLGDLLDIVPVTLSGPWGFGFKLAKRILVAALGSRPAGLGEQGDGPGRVGYALDLEREFKRQTVWLGAALRDTLVALNTHSDQDEARFPGTRGRLVLNAMTYWSLLEGFRGVYEQAASTGAAEAAFIPDVTVTDEERRKILAGERPSVARSEGALARAIGVTRSFARGTVPAIGDDAAAMSIATTVYSLVTTGGGRVKAGDRRLVVSLDRWAEAQGIGPLSDNVRLAGGAYGLVCVSAGIGEALVTGVQPSQVRWLVDWLRYHEEEAELAGSLWLTWAASWKGAKQ